MFYRRYNEMKRQFKVCPGTVAEDDPLSQDEESVWNKHFCDKELSNIIRQDVERTFPGVEFFRKQRIQDVMMNVLFMYARVNPEMCYRQGMHEILAPILFVLHSDHQALLHIQDISGNNAEWVQYNWIRLTLRTWMINNNCFRKLQSIDERGSGRKVSWGRHIVSITDIIHQLMWCSITLFSHLVLYSPKWWKTSNHFTDWTICIQQNRGIFPSPNLQVISQIGRSWRSLHNWISSGIHCWPERIRFCMRI